MDVFLVNNRGLNSIALLSLSLFQVGDTLVQLYHNFITEFETKINILKLAHFAVIVSRQYAEKEATICYLEGIIEKLRATRDTRMEEPVLYIKMQIAAFRLEMGEQIECKNLFDDRKTILDSMTDIDLFLYASNYWLSSQYRKSELCVVHKAALSAQPALVQNEKKLRKKINILRLMEIPLGITAEHTKQEPIWSNRWFLVSASLRNCIYRTTIYRHIVLECSVNGTIYRLSSVVERVAFRLMVVGSTPADGEQSLYYKATI
ncbi:hypothetical protein C5167_025122 [Papaver somniferum]|uniref:PSD13 N-terminal domain-containing protein n=1 Tax=Papaver somniferum TaxID=3469 RepID=A0A4Y7JUE4_PAPSO|nr:hypothetical protein C5167_025122 [Papaver somniferum]